jgi:hypothetical protein
MMGGILCRNSMNCEGMKGTTGFGHTRGFRRAVNPMTVQETIAGSTPTTINLTSHMSRPRAQVIMCGLKKSRRGGKAHLVALARCSGVLESGASLRYSIGAIKGESCEDESKQRVVLESLTWKVKGWLYFGGRIFVNLSKTLL